MTQYSCIVLMFFLLSGCSNKIEQAPSPVVNLESSTRLIRTLISQNKIADILEPHDPEQLNILLNNFSPAEMAFESEVLTTTVPLVVVYYFKDSPQEKEFIQQLNNVAHEYQNNVKFVIVDADALFSLAHDAKIETFPTLIFTANREILEKIEAPIMIDRIKEKIARYLNS